MPVTEGTALLAPALFYARAGLPVFPCRPGGKEPLIPGSEGGRGYLDATCDPDQVGAWWRRWPAANIGIAPVLAELAVLDIDPRHGGMETFALLLGALGALPRSLRCCTGGNGLHLYYRVPADSCLVGSLGPGVDVKYRGHVIAPPSVHPSGNLYAWEDGRGPGEVAVAWLPGKWLDRMMRPAVEAQVVIGEVERGEGGSSTYGMAALRRECDLLRISGEGTRNSQLNRTAFRIAQLAAGGELDPEAARGEVLRAALQAGLGEREALRTLQSAWSAGLKAPRRHGRGGRHDA